MRDDRTGGRRSAGTGSGPARGRQGAYGREQAPRSYSRPVPRPTERAQPQYERAQPQYEYARQAPAKRAGKVPLLGLGVVALLVVIAVAVVIGIFANIERNSLDPNTVTAGVKIDGKDYSGWDVKRLNMELKQAYQKKIDDIEIKVTWKDKTWVFGGEDLGATENVDEVVSRAAMLARVGSKEQMLAEAKQVREEGRDFTVQFTLDQEKLKSALLEKTADLIHNGTPASVMFNPNLVNFDIEPLPYDTEEFHPPQEQVDAMFLVTPETPGKQVDVDLTAQKIMDALQQSSKVQVELIVNDFVPQVTEALLRESFHLLTAYRTQLKGSTEDRTSNIRTALERFNGHVMLPGEVISFNEMTGERSEANGYKMAHVIGADKSLVDDYGGGVCQASTTLYNAAMMAGCEVIERRPHSFPSSYAKKGFDAMVNWPNSDLKFKNVSDSNLYIKAYVKEPYVYVMVFGKPLKNAARITRVSEEVYVGPEPPLEVREDKKGEYAEEVYYVDDKPYVLVKGQPEMRYTSYLVYWDANGKEIERKKLFDDKFKEIKRGEIIGTHTHDGSTPPKTTGEPGSQG